MRTVQLTLGQWLDFEGEGVVLHRSRMLFKISMINKRAPCSAIANHGIFSGCIYSLNFDAKIVTDYTHIELVTRYPNSLIN